LKGIEAALEAQRAVKVLAIGSSSTAGIGASSPIATYPARLEDELEQQFPRVDVEVVNRGLPGEVAKDAAERIKLEVAEVKPDLVVWQVGTNDALARVDIDTFKDILGQTLAWLQQNEFDIVLVEPQFNQELAQNEYYMELVNAIAEMAQSQGVPLVRRFEATQYLAQSAPNRSHLALRSLHRRRVPMHGHRSPPCLAGPQTQLAPPRSQTLLL